MTPGLAGRRVVFVLNYAVFGGAERQALLLARHLIDNEGASVEACALTEQDGRAPKLFRQQGIPWHGIEVNWTGSRWDKRKRLLRLARALRRLAPDVVMPYTTIPNVACGLVWRWSGASLCVWNQLDVNPSTRVGEKTIRRAVGKTPRFAACSRECAELVIGLGAPKEHVSVIHTAVELAEPRWGRAAWRARLDVAEESFLVSCLAHLHRFKDHDTLLRAWRKVVDELVGTRRDAVLVLAGRPAGTEEALKALAYDLELGRSVRFLGEIEDVAGLLEASDLGVLSSRAEGFPNAVVESMASGLAVAGTDIPGLREPLGPEGSALLAPPGDAQGLSAAIVRAARNPDLRRMLGERNRERARTEFSPQRLFEQRVAQLTEGLTLALRKGPL